MRSALLLCVCDTKPSENDMSFAEAVAPMTTSATMYPRRHCLLSYSGLCGPFFADLSDPQTKINKHVQISIELFCIVHIKFNVEALCVSL